jgi:hypothetical protein
VNRPFAILALVLLVAFGGQTRAVAKMHVGQNIASGGFMENHDTRVWPDGAASLDFAGEIDGCGYETASGRSKWLSEDPFGSVTSRMNAGMFGTASLDYYLMGVSQPEMLPFGPNLYGYVGNNPVMMYDPDGEVAPLVVIGGGILVGLAFDYVIDKVKNRNVKSNYTCDLSTAANAAGGGAVAPTLPTETKPRGGVAGGGRAGSATSLASSWNHSLIKNPVIRNRVTSCLRKVPYVGTALGAAQLGDAYFNPTPSNE